jgi:DNA-binding NtrC family response regulator
MSDPAKILIVDDEPFNVDVLEQELELLGYQTASAGNGSDALNIAETDNPDLILLDVVMPAMDGFEVCERLKASAVTKDIPVIFMTALSETADKVKAFSIGGVDYIMKPFQNEELLARVRTHLELRHAQLQLIEQNARLRQEIEAHQQSKATIEYLREEIKTGHNFEEIIGDSKVLRKLLEKLRLVAATDSTVLIEGETGTGKELIARAIHNRSARRQRPLVKVNCAALPRELIESELFGHEKGAFTGATQQRKGRFELADTGTVFLDEVGELSAEAQAKLLRILQEQEFERVGGAQSIRVDVRVIAATNRDLQTEVDAGRFRSDLFYRLNVFPLTALPLRERKSDIALLAQHFLDKSARKLGKNFEGLAPDTLTELNRYSWPGNVRELENVVERAAILSPGPLLEVEESLVPRTSATAPASGTLDEVERTHILRVLEDNGWVIEGDQGAAATLGLNPSTLRGRLRKLGITRAR